MSLLIVIVNYRTPAITLDCLASLSRQIDDVPGTRVVLVDNASGDDSIPRIRDAMTKNGWESWLTLVASPTNTGFAGGNNLGIGTLPAHPDARFVLLLNSDTLVEPNVLRTCVDKMEADATVGVLSCLLLNRDRTVQNAARKMPTPVRMVVQSLGLPWLAPGLFSWAKIEDPGWNRRTETRDVDWVGGAFMLIRREVLDRLGGLDERFFFYGEDIEFCHRARKNGWRIRYDPSASIIHLAGASSDPSRLPDRQRMARMWQARYLVQRRCYGVVAEWVARGTDIAAMGLRCVKLLIRGRRKSDEFARQRDVLAILLRWPASAARKG